VRFARRDADVPPLSDTLRRLRDGAAGDRIRLQGLSPADVRRLAEVMGRPVPPRRVAEELCGHTGGNALYLRALLDELDDEALTTTARELPAPRSYAAVVAGKVDDCPAPTRELLEAGAVLGDRFLLDEAGAMLGQQASRPGDLDAATRTGLLEVERSGNQWRARFAHPLVRAAIYARLAPGRRTALHTRAAEVVQESRALHHRLAAAPTEDAALAADLMGRALGAAGSGRLRDAGDLLLAASRLRPAGAERDYLLCSAVDLILWAGEQGEATALIDDVDACAPTARRNYVLGQHRLQEGRLDEAEPLLVEAWDAHNAAGEPDLHLLIATTLANVNLRRARGDDIVTWARRAREVSIGLAPVEGLARGLEAAGLTLSGRVDEAQRILADLPPDPAQVPPDLGSLLVGRVLLNTWSDRLASAEADASAVVEAGRVAGTPLWMISAAGYLAEARWRIGKWDAATAAGELSASLAEDTDQSWALACAYALSSMVLSSRGQWDIATARVTAAVASAERFGDEMSLLYSANAAVHLAACRRDDEGVVEAGAMLLKLRNRHSLEPGVFTWPRQYLEALVHLGRVEEANGLLAEFSSLAEDRNRTSSLSDAARVRAAVAVSEGDLSAATDELERALEHAEAIGARPAIAQTQLALGMVLRRADKRRLAGDLLAPAHETLAALGAVETELAEQELSACGRRRNRGPSRSAELSPQELTVAGLVATGMSNRDVADELFISVKTVEYHLGHVYAKLGVRSRTQLAAQFAHSQED
jgi:ATP/maltotriose-dependent transcriptional regulator MalT